MTLPLPRRLGLWPRTAAPEAPLTRAAPAALLTAAAGLSAYVRKGSSKSLLISSAVAVLLLVSASLMGHPTYRVGTQLALATCLVLAGAMGYRAKASAKMVPAGVVALLSALMSAGYIATLI
jgi:uncharacterized membrane protein (UPF0136 family)